MTDINECIKAFTPIVGILCLAIVATEAFQAGLDGTIWIATSSGIALLAGIKAPDLKSALQTKFS